MSSLGIRRRLDPKLSLCVSHRPNEIVTTRTPASTRRRAIRKWSMQQGAPSPSLIMSPTPYLARRRGSSRPRSRASNTRRENRMSNACRVYASIPSIASEWSWLRRSSSSWISKERRLASRAGTIVRSSRLSPAEPLPGFDRLADRSLRKGVNGA